MNARTRRLLEAPVAPTLLRLAAPNVLVMVLQAVVTTMDAVFVGWLGTDALAGCRSCIRSSCSCRPCRRAAWAAACPRPSRAPSARAAARQARGARRARGAHRPRHGRPLHRRPAPRRARAVPAPWAAGARPSRPPSPTRTSCSVAPSSFWLLNTLTSVVRGTGTMVLPAAITTGSALLYLGLAPALVMGWGPFPAPRSGRHGDREPRRLRPGQPRADRLSRLSVERGAAHLQRARDPSRALLGDPARGRARLRSTPS